MEERITKEKRWKLEEIRWMDVVLCVLAIAFARIAIMGEFYTLAIGYLASLYMDKQLRKWGTVFTIVGLLSIQPFGATTIKYIFIALVLFGVDNLLIRDKTQGVMKIQIVSVIGSVWLVNIIFMFFNSFNWLSLFSYCIEGMVAGASVFVLQEGVRVIRNRRQTPLTTKETISMIFIFSCILGGMVDLYITIPIFKEIYMRDVLTFILLIGVTYLGGINIGVTVSVVMGSILIIIGYMPVNFLPVYAIAVLVGGIFSPAGRPALILATGIGQLIGFAIFNDRVWDLQLIGAYLCAAIISLILPKKYFGIDTWFGGREKEDEQTHLIRVQSILTERLDCFAKAFEKLSSTFRDVSNKKLELTLSGMKNIIEDTGEKLCANCSMNTFCWEQDIINTYEEACVMLDTADKKGFLTIGDIPKEFQSHCCNSQQFAYMLNFKLDLYKQNLIWQNRMVESRELMGEQLKAMAHTILNLSKEVQEELYFNKENEKRLAESLKAAGIKIRDVMILENTKGIQEILLYTQPCLQHDLNVKLLLETMYTVLGVKVELEKYESEKAGCKLRFLISRMYQVSAGAAFCAKNKISGDVYSFMELQDGQYLLALADGMGSGQLAKAESTATIELLEDLMEAGFKNELAVKLINSVLVLKSTEENFSTMDVTLIDRKTGIAEFLKAGAATTFILRDGEVFSIKAISLPVGILKDIDIEVYKKQLQHGDVVIMVTDGMLDSKDDPLGKEDTFKHFILEVDSDNPSYMAEYLMKKSCDLLGNSDKDDMTIVVAKVWEKFSA